MARFIQLYALVLAAFATLAMADIMRVPLRQRHHGRRGLRLVDRNGRETEVADMAAIKRQIEHINRRYGAQEAQNGDIERRWVSNHVLDRVPDEGFTQREDAIQDAVTGIISKAAGSLTPFLGKIPTSQSESSASSSSKASKKKKKTSKQTSGSKASKSKSSDSSGGGYRSAQGNAESAVALSDNVSGGSDVEFVGQISVGTPAQNFPIDPDTGSSDLWVIGQQCQSKNCGPDSRGKFQSSKSSTYQPINDQSLDLSYGIGDVSGSMARDTVKVGSLTIQKQVIGVANRTSPDWADDKASGVLGLAFRALASINQRPFIQNLASQNALKQNVVSFAFGRSASGTTAKSEMLLGDTNSKLFKGQISYYGLTQETYWQTSFKSLGSGSDAGITGAEGIFDTGTSLIAVNKKQAAAFWKGVQGAKLSSDGSYYSFPCAGNVNAKLTMPDGRAFSLSNSDLNLGTDGRGSNQCVGAVMIAGTPGPIVLGLTFLKNVYSVFDFGQNRLGLTESNL